MKFSFTLVNTGSRAGKETTQIYFGQKFTSTTTPVMRLIRFQKVELQPGEDAQLQFSFNAEELKLWNVEMQHVFEPGEFSLMVGASAHDIKLRGEFYRRGVTEVISPRILTRCERHERPHCRCSSAY